MTEAREVARRELWAAVAAIPGLAEGLKLSQEELWTENPWLWHVNGDVSYTVAIDDNGLFLLTRFDRGQGEPAFRSNDARACVASMVLQWLSGSNDFYPGHSPYEEIPRIFEVSEHHEIDEFGRDCSVIRWHWGEGSWAQSCGAYSLLNGLKWAWIFTASDKTIANAASFPDGFPLFLPHPGPRLETPPGDLSNLSLERWQAWRSARTAAGEVQGAGPEQGAGAGEAQL
ncbi:hypothetical protein [Specibacter sp. NPDC078709]|uniref:hypothetical protein n=1 Tax=unclassified Specibacter TaxID=3081321 RepID=UPI003440224E